MPSPSLTNEYSIVEQETDWEGIVLLAGELGAKLGLRCPKMVRMYGSAIEKKDYPVPRGDLRSTRGMRDLKSDPELQVR